MSSKVKRAGQTKIDKLPLIDISKVKTFRSFVLYGRSGSGKTTLAGTFPTPILYLDVKDRGTDSIANVKGIKAMEVNSMEDFEMAYWYLKQHPGEFKTVVIDTVSQLQQIVVTEVAQEKKKDPARALEWGVLSQRDWGDIAAVLKEWIINFRDLEMNVVFIAQDRTFNLNEDDGTDGALAPEVGPALSPSVARVLNAAVSMIGNTFIRSRTIVKTINGKKKESDKIEYCLRVGPNPVYITKVRKPRSELAPDLIVDPTYDDIIAVITGEEGE